jgi:ribosomal-protein-serine acetyltransferase
MAPARPQAISAAAFNRVDIVDGPLTLRPLDGEEAAALFRLIDGDRDRLGEWLPWVDETRSESDSARFIADAAEERQRRRSLVLGMFVDGALAGTIGLHYIEWFDRCAEVGYWVAREREGQGHVARAARAVLRFAFETAGLNRIVIRCAIGNDRSRRVAERLGFRCEGILREAHYVRGRYLDQHLYALLRREFESIAGARSA